MSRANNREHSIHWLQCVGLILVLNGTYAACSRILYVVHFVAIQSVKQDEAVKRERTRGRKGDTVGKGANCGLSDSFSVVATRGPLQQKP